MIDLRPSSRKLKARGLWLVEVIGGVSSTRAQRCLRASGGRTKTAIVMARFSVSAREARRRLTGADGSLRRCLEESVTV